MSDICVIYGSKDAELVGKLVALLKRDWQVWWDKDIHSGNWESAVRAAIGKAKAVVPVISPNTEGSDVFRDELELAKKKGKKVFPFVIAEADLPLGFGSLHRTDAIGWAGQDNRDYKLLREKIHNALGCSSIIKPRSLTLRGKSMTLPAMIFSLSSHETQLDPTSGIALLGLATPPAGLVSAYDIYDLRKDKELFQSIDVVRRSSCVLVLDSGNYEAFRKSDVYDPKKHKSGWRRERFLQIAARVSPDMAFSFDHPAPTGRANEIADAIIASTQADEQDISGRDYPICPIIHLPEKQSESIPRLASTIITRVVKALDPVMIAIPERELGDGIVERARTVREIRRALDSLGKYYPLHLLGTGNPLSMMILSAFGADSFDGLEWCRTAADWDGWRLHHTQHFDFFSKNNLGRLPAGLRGLAQNDDVPYSLRVACYNMAAFQHWVREIQSRIGTPSLGELLELHIPGIGTRLNKELNNDPDESA